MRPWLGILFFTFFTVFHVLAARADCPESASAPLEDSGIPALEAALAGDSPGGPAIGSSCTRGLARETVDKLEAKIRRVAELVRSQSARCASELGFVELSDIPSILERIRIRCVNFRRGSLAANAGEGRGRSVRILIDRGILGLPNATSGEKELSDRELALTLLHEALHSTTSGAPPLHNWHGRRRPSTGCDRSIYADRIYLIPVACFGDFEGFHASESPSFRCAGVCEQALASGEPRRTEGGGPRPRLIAYPEDEAQAVCDRVRRSGEELWTYRWGNADPARLTRLQALYDRSDRLAAQASDELRPVFVESRDWDALSRSSGIGQWVQLARWQAMSAASEAPWIHDSALRNLDRYRASVASDVADLCAKAGDTTFCRATASELLSELDRARAEVAAGLPQQPPLWLGI